MNKLFINIIGHNGTGKTTLAKKLEADLDANRINGDDLRLFVKNNVHYFGDLDDSYKNAKFDLLNPLIIAYRIQLTEILLQSGQSVIYEGSGFTKKWRSRYLPLAKSIGATTVVITCTASEAEILSRLSKRQNGNKWIDQYYSGKKHAFEEPETDEADIVLVYSQNNYDDILKILTEAYSQPNSL